MELYSFVGQGIALDYGEVICKRHQMNNVKKKKKPTKINLIFRLSCILLTCIY